MFALSPCMKRVIPYFPCHSRRKGEVRYWRESTVYTIGRLEGELDQRNRIRQAKSNPP
jgi:hypothetical protein